MRIGIVDYGAGNLTCVLSAFKFADADVYISKNPEELATADKLVLPGVGAFADSMQKLREHELVEMLEDQVLVQKKPFLGVCVGAQLICKDSTEFGSSEGLGWIDAHVRKIEKTTNDLRIPHMGWNDAIRNNDSTLFDDLEEDTLFYYAHSYAIYANDPDVVVASCTHGNEFAAALQKDNIFATQFHPEKSQIGGLAIIKNFVEKT